MKVNKEYNNLLFLLSEKIHNDAGFITTLQEKIAQLEKDRFKEKAVL